MSDIMIKNEALTVTISTLGAEIQSIRDCDGTELMWSGDPSVWSGHAPVLFPIAGSLKEDTYRYNGREYTMKQHGFGRRSEFAVETASETAATFLLRDNAQTREQYPFSFALRITYTLEGSHLHVDYQVDNAGEDTMYFSIGSHEAYSCPNGVEEYSIIFDKPETLATYVIEGRYLSLNTRPVMENERELKLTYDLFETDSLVFSNLQSEGVTLLHRPSGREIRVEFPGFPYLVFWTKENANYICIEPWFGLPDTIGSSYELTEKMGIIPLSAKAQWKSRHTITF